MSVAAPADLSPRAMTGMFAACAIIYLIFYALSGPIRFGLFLIGKDNLIFARDAFIFVPIGLLFAAQAMKMRVHSAFMIAGVLFAFHGLVLMGTVGNLPAVLYGIKVLINVLFGFFTAGALIAPEKKTLKLLAAIWVVTLIGVLLDKAGVVFPWSGIRTVIGGLDVDVSKDWQVQDPLARRVAGFARSSISVAAVMPCLAIVLAPQIRSVVLRFLMLMISAGVVAMTTQKGAFIAFVPIALVLCLPLSTQLRSIRFLCVAFIILCIALPPLTLSLHMDHGTGVFSSESLFLRIAYTWPQAWDWIDRHQMLIFGVGLGGISGAQRLYALDRFNPADNIMVLMYAYFGVFAFIYIGLTGFLACRPVVGRLERVIPCVAIIAFAFGYGTVLSILEDQAIPLFLGAAIAVLLQETAWSKPRAVADMKMGNINAYAGLGATGLSRKPAFKKA